MKKIVYQLFAVFLILSCSSVKKVGTSTNEPESDSPIYYDFAGEINTAQLSFIRENYNWKDEGILIVNYVQPVSSCHFDNNNRVNNKGGRWWNDFYSKVNTTDCLNIHVLANGERVKKKLDDTFYFDDKYDFFLDNFFKRKKSCFGVLVLNKKGNYYQYNGHYSEKQVDAFIQLLKDKTD